jgi:hypothetical protein
MKAVHPRSSKNDRDDNKEAVEKAVQETLGQNAKVIYKLVAKSIQTDIAMKDMAKISTCKCDGKLEI